MNEQFLIQDTRFIEEFKVDHLMDLKKRTSSKHSIKVWKQGKLKMPDHWITECMVLVIV